MKKLYSLLMGLFFLFSSYAQTELVLCTTGYGFDRSSSNGINPDVWTYIQKWASLTHNSQDASVTAVRLHVQWEQYEPTLGDYHGAKLAQAVQAILGLKSGMKVALHFAYQRPGSMNDSYTATADIARLSDGTLAQENITYTLPSMYSQTMRERFYAFVDDALDHVSSYYNNILYVQMGNGSAEEFVIPNVERNNTLEPAFYEQKAADSWRQEYLPCRYPGQSTVTWNGTTQTISSAPTFPYTNTWDTDHGREYHRFAGWGLMRFYKGFRDVVKAHSNNLKVLYFISDFGNSNGNARFLHGSTLPMGMQEFDGIYTSDGVGQYDGATKIRAIDVMKGTSPNKIAAIEFDPDDLGQVFGVNNINPNIAAEWMPRAYKHGVNYIHFAMYYPDADINLLAPVLASLRTNYVNGSYTPPSRQSATTVNIYPTVFYGTHLFESAYNTLSGTNWGTTDNNPVSINMIDDGYWQNIWSCSSNPDPCSFTVSASTSNSNPTAGASITLTGSCNGQCTGVSYSWSGNGISGSGGTKTFNAPSTAGTYTYTVTGSKDGCSNKTGTVNVTVGGGGGGSFSQCKESESSSGTGAVTSDPNASNGDTRGEENNYNHYVDYSITGVPSAGSYNVTLTYYSSTAPTVAVSANGGSAATVNLSNSGSWNIVKTTHTFSVTLASGNNTIRIAGTGGGSCRQDKICVEGTGGGCTTPSAPSLSASPSTITSGNSTTLSASGCSGGTITWSHSLGTGASKSASPTSNTTYTASCTVDGCVSSEGSVTVTVNPPEGGPFSQCKESESSSGTGAITSDPNASNGDTRGEENNYNHYVDYAITGVPSAGTYNVTLTYYSSSAPTIAVSVNSGSATTINLANSGSWNIVKTTHTFNVTLASGSNTIRIAGTGGGSCRQDKICVANGSASILGIGPDETVNKAFTVYPNPTKGVFETNFYLEVGKKATLVVTDFVGRQIYRQNITGKGMHRERINLNNKASGTLLLQLIKDNKVEVKKVTVVR